MGTERRSPSSGERRRMLVPAEGSGSVATPDVEHLGRRIGPVWLSVSQLCRRWQLSRKTIYKFIDAGLLPAWKVGPRLYRVAVDDVLRFEAELPAVRSDRRISVPRKH
jgi:excisionase family DNA binding protein